MLSPTQLHDLKFRGIVPNNGALPKRTITEYSTEELDEIQYEYYKSLARRLGGDYNLLSFEAWAKKRGITTSAAIEKEFFVLKPVGLA